MGKTDEKEEVTMDQSLAKARTRRQMVSEVMGTLIRGAGAGDAIAALLA